MSNYAIWGLLGPATWPWWLTAVAAVGIWSRRVPLRVVRWLLVGAALLIVGLAVIPTGTWLATPLETRFSPPRFVMADHIVVLAGAEDLAASEIAGRPEVTAAGDRIIQGATLARAMPAAKLWIVGGVRMHGHSDVEWTALSWRRLGVEAYRIGIIDGTYDTCANAAGVRGRHLRGEILLVTSAMHMPRAVACFRSAGVSVQPYPVDYRTIPQSAGPWRPTLSGNAARADEAIHEWIGLAYYRLTGRIDTLLPKPEPARSAQWLHERQKR